MREDQDANRENCTGVTATLERTSLEEGEVKHCVNHAHLYAITNMYTSAFQAGC